MSLADIRLLARRYAQVPAAIVSQGDGSDEDSCIQSAVREYSSRLPRRLVANAQATGLYVYDLAVFIADWSDSHQMVSVRPIRRGGRPLDNREWWIGRTASGWELRLESPINEQLELEYLAPHVVSSMTDTIPAQDLEALGHLAASFILEVAANYYARQTSSTIQADAVAPEQQRQAYALQSREERQLFEAMISRRAGAASGLTFSLDTQDSATRFWRSR